MSSAHRLAPFVAAVALIARAAAAAPSAASAPSFRDVANPLRCYDLYPSWGLSWADFDLDGTPDLWIANHVAQPGRLFRNRIDVFQPVHGAIEHAGQDDHFGGWADVDGDGDPDLYAANGAYQRSSLFENNNGVFVDRSEAHGLTARSVGRGRFAIWADFNGDGWSDLYLSNFYSPDQFYLNDRHGKLKDAYETSGISNNFQKDAACYGDVDGDGDEDVFLPLLGPRSILFINRGDGTFDSRLIDIGNSSHACALADFNGDGTLDLFVAGHDSDQLLLNDGRGGFTDASESAGLTAPTSGLRSVLVQDFDNDGSLDVYATNGGAPDGDDARDTLYLNDGRGHFRDATEAAGLATIFSGNTQAAAAADYNEDGFVDIAVSNGGGAKSLSGPLAIYRNEMSSGPARNFVAIRPRRLTGSADVLEGRLRLLLPGGKRMVREINPTRRMAQDSPWVHVGLGPAPFVATLAFEDTTGHIEQRQSVPAGAFWTVLADGRDTFIQSHPAALLANRNLCDLNAVEAILPKRKFQAEPAEVAHRREELLAYAFVNDLRAGIAVSSADVDAELSRLSERSRRQVDEVVVLKPDEKTSRQILNVLAAGQSVSDMKSTLPLRAYENWYESKHGIAADFIEGYYESGWMTRPMLKQRFGPSGDGIFSSTTAVIGPLKAPRSRYTHFLRLGAFERPAAAGVSRPDAQRAIERRRLTDELGRFQKAGVRDLVFWPYPVDVHACAAAARENGLEYRPDVKAALERIDREAAVDAAVAAAVADISPKRADVEAHIQSRRDTMPRWGARVVVFFANSSGTAAEIHDALMTESADKVAKSLKIPDLREYAARTGAAHMNRCFVTDATGEIMFGTDHFAEVKKFKEGQVSEIWGRGREFTIVKLEKLKPPPDSQEAYSRARNDVRRLMVLKFLNAVADAAAGVRPGSGE